MTLTRKEIKRRKKYKAYRKHRNAHPNDNSPLVLRKKLIKQFTEAIDGADFYNKLKSQENTSEFVKKENVDTEIIHTDTAYLKDKNVKKNENS